MSRTVLRGQVAAGRGRPGQRGLERPQRRGQRGPRQVSLGHQGLHEVPQADAPAVHHVEGVRDVRALQAEAARIGQVVHVREGHGALAGPRVDEGAAPQRPHQAPQEPVVVRAAPDDAGAQDGGGQARGAHRALRAGLGEPVSVVVGLQRRVLGGVDLAVPAIHGDRGEVDQAPHARSHGRGRQVLRGLHIVPHVGCPGGQGRAGRAVHHRVGAADHAGGLARDGQVPPDHGGRGGRPGRRAPGVPHLRRHLMTGRCQPLGHVAPHVAAGAGDEHPHPKDDPGVAKKARSASVVSRPSRSLRCGKRPKRATTSRWRWAYSV